MKNTILLVLISLLSNINLRAQMKIGKNPKSISNNLMFQVETSNSNNISIDTFGKFGIGTTNPVSKFELVGGGMVTLTLKDSGLQSMVLFRSSISSGSISDWKLYKSDGKTGYPQGMHLFSYPKDGTSFGGCCHASMSWLDNGNVGIGSINPPSKLDIWSDQAHWTQVIRNINSGGLGLWIDLQQITTNNMMLAFSRGATTLGSVTYNGTGVSYNTTSDERLKRNIINTRFGLNDIKKIKVYDYYYKSDSNNMYPNTGFLAQQLYDIYPVAVTVGGENVYNNPWSVDYSKLTPILVKSIQDLSNISESKDREIKTLQIKLNMLENELTEIKEIVKKLK